MYPVGAIVLPLVAAAAWFLALKRAVAKKALGPVEAAVGLPLAIVALDMAGWILGVLLQANAGHSERMASPLWSAAMGHAWRRPLGSFLTAIGAGGSGAPWAQPSGVSPYFGCNGGSTQQLIAAVGGFVDQSSVMVLLGLLIAASLEAIFKRAG